MQEFAIVVGNIGALLRWVDILDFMKNYANFIKMRCSEKLILTELVTLSSSHFVQIVALVPFLHESATIPNFGSL
jgi:glutaredoxin-related protein